MKSNSKKRLFSFLLILTMLGSMLTGCGIKDESLQYQEKITKDKAEEPEQRMTSVASPPMSGSVPVRGPFDIVFIIDNKLANKTGMKENIIEVSETIFKMYDKVRISIIQVHDMDQAETYEYLRDSNYATFFTCKEQVVSALASLKKVGWWNNDECMISDAIKQVYNQAENNVQCKPNMTYCFAIFNANNTLYKSVRNDQNALACLKDLAESNRSVNISTIANISDQKLQDSKNSYGEALSSLTNGMHFDSSWDNYQFSDQVLGHILGGDYYSGLFYYAGVQQQDHFSKLYYMDSYFSNSAYIFNHSLATASLSFAMSAFGSSVGGSDDYTNKSKNAKDFLEQIGFEDFQCNDWFTKKPIMDSIGVVMAHKKITANGKPYTLLAVAARGAGYEAEWGSNFKVGYSGDHQGFTKAKEDVQTFMKDYIASNGITGDIKLWITGYSRASATTNLVAGEINNGDCKFENCTITPANLYCYGFETPAGSQDVNCRKSIHGNIFCIVNPNDFVPKVAPRAMGFRRYGVDKFIPTESTSDNFTSEETRMKDMYTGLTSYIDENDKVVLGEYGLEESLYDDIRGSIEEKVRAGLKAQQFILIIGNPSIAYPCGTIIPGYQRGTPIVYTEENVKNITDNIMNTMSSYITESTTQDEFLDHMINTLMDDYLLTQYNYTNQYQDMICTIFRILFYEHSAQRDCMIEGFLWDLVFNSSDLYDAICANPNPDKAKNLLADLFKKNMTKYCVNLEDTDVDEFVSNLYDLCGEIIENDLDLVLSIVCAVNRIGLAHYPELCLAWMKSNDPNFGYDGPDILNDGSYRVASVKCPVDLRVYDDQNALVAAIINDEPQVISGSSIVSSVSKEGAKTVKLPSNVSYKIKITATDAGNVSVSIKEYSQMMQDTTRIVSYYDVPIKKGDQLTLQAPVLADDDLENGVSSGSDVVYQLLDADQKKVTVSKEFSGEDAQKAEATISLRSNHDEYGYTEGAGRYEIGDYALITAIPYDAYEFEGWYLNNLKVSSDYVYQFRVESDMELVAKFIDPAVTKLDGRLPKPLTSLGSGIYSSQQSIELSCMDKDAKIYYTLDGTIPSTKSMLYEHPIKLTSSTEINAYAVKAGFEDSKVATYQYTMITTSKDSNTPTVTPKPTVTP